MKYVCYYRVSSLKQQASGLGIEAQREAVKNYLSNKEHEVVAEFTETESGRKSKRPELTSALKECRKQKACLLVARTDRLSRNVHFLSGLMEQKVEFVAADNPHATNLTLHIMAAVAEEEARLISIRTKAALAAAKERGVKLGTHSKVLNEESKRKADSFAKSLSSSIKEAVIETFKMHKRTSYRSIADVFNRKGLKTDRGGKWHGNTIQRACERIGLEIIQMAKKLAKKKAAKKKAPAKKAAKKKAPAKKAAKKKAPAKKVAKKKVPAKKVPAKKAAKKKALAKKLIKKKAAAKKAPAKKAATKKLVRRAAAPKKEEEEDIPPIPVRPKLRKSSKLSNFEKKQQQKLRDLRDSLVDAMAGVARDNLRSDADGGDSSAFGMHQADAGSDAYDRDFALNLLSQEQDALHEIEEALKRIDYGTYGVCEMSKKKIIHARLEAIPFARYTVECQAQIEKESGLRGGRRLPDRSNMMGFMDEGSGLDNS